MNASIPHFFKIILSDKIFQGNLCIPKMFVRRYGNHLSDKVFLKVPNGSKWQVELVKSGDKFYFGNGWQQFAEHYSLSHGSFLVFGFENFETCCVSVVIFDKSASEIKYPEITASDIHSRSCKKLKQNNWTEQSQDKRNPRLNPEKRKPLSADDNADITKSYESESACFSITMGPAYVSERFRLTIPPAAANKYFSKERGSTILNCGDGNTWSVNYIKYKTNCARTLTIISRGWKKFVLDNHLAVGDACVFEPTNGNADELKVAISRKEGDACETISSTGTNKRSNIGDLMELKNPFFKVDLSQNFLRKKYINVPAKLIEKCENQSIEKATLKVGSRAWPVKLRPYPAQRIYHLSDGFSAFIHDNDLQVGDTCVFELIDSKSFLLKVSIVRDVD